MDEYVGTINCFAFNFTPYGWLPCNGQILPVTAQYAALYALLRSTYGGNGTTTFGLPNLNGSFPIGGATLGVTGGSMMATLTNNNMPAHSHPVQGTGTMLVTNPGNFSFAVTMPASSLGGLSNTPSNSSGLAESDDPTDQSEPCIYTEEPPNTTLGGLTKSTPSMTLNTNGAVTGPFPINSVPATIIPVMPPYLVLNFCICVSGGMPIPSADASK